MSTDMSRPRAVLSDDEAGFIAEQAVQIGVGCIVTLGSWRGDVAAALARGLAQRTHPLQDGLVCVDPQPFLQGHGLPGEIAGESLAGSEGAASVRLLNLDSRHAARGFPHRVGLLSVDGCATPEDGRRDIRSWLPLLTPGAKVLFRDDSHAEGAAAAMLRDLTAGGQLRHVSTVGRVSLLEDPARRFQDAGSPVFASNEAAFRSAAQQHGYEPQYAFDRMSYGSFISRRYKILYVETPKAACTSLKNLIAKLEGIDFEPLRRKPYYMETKINMFVHQRLYVNIPTLFEIEQEEFEGLSRPNSDWFRFAVTRNPFSRLFSFYVNKLLLKEPGDLPIYNMFGNVDSTEALAADFSRFVSHLSEDFQTLSRWEFHLAQQCDLLLPELIAYDEIFKIESLDRLSQALSKRTGIPDLSIPHSNRAIIEGWRSFYNDESIRIVKNLYAKDFDRFGYSLDLHDAGDGRPAARQAGPVDFKMINEIRQRNELIKYLYTMII